MRKGVKGSSRPGLRRTGILRTGAGSQSELTAGALLGRETPNAWVVGKKFTSSSPSDERPRSKRSSGIPRVSPPITVRICDMAAWILPHVHAHQGVRKLGQGREGLDVVLWALGALAERELLVQEELGRLLAIVGEGLGGHFIEGRARLLDLEKIAPDEPGIGGVGEDRRPAVTLQFDRVETAILLAQAQDRDVDLVAHACLNYVAECLRIPGRTAQIFDDLLQGRLGGTGSRSATNKLPR